MKIKKIFFVYTVFLFCFVWTAFIFRGANVDIYLKHVWWSELIYLLLAVFHSFIMLFSKRKIIFLLFLGMYIPQFLLLQSWNLAIFTGVVYLIVFSLSRHRVVIIGGVAQFFVVLLSVALFHFIWGLEPTDYDEKIEITSILSPNQAYEIIKYDYIGGTLDQKSAITVRANLSFDLFIYSLVVNEQEIYVYNSNENLDIYWTDNNSISIGTKIFTYPYGYT